MNMVYAFTYLCLVLFLSLVSCHVPSTGLYILGYIYSRYFIIFEAIVNRILFLVSSSDSSLPMYRNATDF